MSFVPDFKRPAARPLWALSALEQAELLRQRQISSVELTTLALSRIGKLNPSVSAFVSIFHEEALAVARAKDRARLKGHEGAPLLGVPTAIKDLNLVRGHRTYFGSRAFPWGLWSPIDDRTTATFRAAGMVFLGKTTTPEFGVLPITEPRNHAPTRNPWSLRHTPGGSSGGAASAVASGMVAVAHASDGAGSIRIPASFCGLFGLKPTRHRVANAFGRSEHRILYGDGVLSRTVEDSAVFLDLLSKKRGRATPLAAPLLPFGESVARQKAGDKTPRLSIRLVLQSPVSETNPEVAAVVTKLANTLATLGHKVTTGPFIVGEVEEFLPMWSELVAQDPILLPALLESTTRWLFKRGKAQTRATIEQAWQDLGQRLTNFWQNRDFDLLLTPTVPVLPPEIGATAQLVGADRFYALAPLGAFTAVCNVSGQPAASVPAGFSSDGRPIGAQFIAGHGEEATLFAIAQELEQALGWPEQWPELALRDAVPASEQRSSAVS